MDKINNLIEEELKKEEEEIKKNKEERKKKGEEIEKYKRHIQHCDEMLQNGQNVNGVSSDPLQNIQTENEAMYNRFLPDVNSSGSSEVVNNTSNNGTVSFGTQIETMVGAEALQGQNDDEVTIALPKNSNEPIMVYSDLSNIQTNSQAAGTNNGIELPPVLPNVTKVKTSQGRKRRNSNAGKKNDEENAVKKPKMDRDYVPGTLHSIACVYLCTICTPVHVCVCSQLIHSSLVSPEPDHKCSFCEFSTSDQNVLKDHMRDTHEKCGSKCFNGRGKKYSDKTSFVEHLRIHFPKPEKPEYGTADSNLTDDELVEKFSIKC